MDPRYKPYVILAIFVVVLIAASYISYQMGFSAGALDALSTPLNRPAPHAL